MSATITGVLAADVQSLIASPTVASVSVTDTAADVQANFMGLEFAQEYGKLGTISLTDGGTPTIGLSEAEYIGGGSILSHITGPYTLEIVPFVTNTLPDISRSFTAPTLSEIDAELTRLLPAGHTPRVATASGVETLLDNMSEAKTLNAFVYKPSVKFNGSIVDFPAGYQVGYVLTRENGLRDNGSGKELLIGAAPFVTLIGAPKDTLYGGDGNATLKARAGSETLVSGAGANVLYAGSGNDVIRSEGSDTITAGTAGADTITASGPSAVIFGGNAALDVIGAATALTVVGGDAGNTVSGGSGNQVVFGTNSLDYAGASGAATLIGGSAGSTVTGGSGSLLVFAENSLTFTGGSGSATVAGGGAPMAATLGGGGGALFGGTSGGNLLAADDGSAVIIAGNAGGDTLAAIGSGSDLLVAGGGSDLLDASASTGTPTLFGGGGDTLLGGSGDGVLAPGAGNETLTGGGGHNDYLFFASPGTSRVDTITDFDTGRNAIGLYGFGSGADAAALASATPLNSGATSVTLGDGTQIVFLGSVSLQPYNFF